MSSSKVEIWKEVVGYEGIYLVSSKGRIKSVARVIHRKNGHSQTIKGKILSQRKGPYYNIKLRKQGKEQTLNVHSIVASAFLGHKPNGHKNLVVDHIDKNQYNNELSNLRLISHKDNIMRGFGEKFKDKQRLISKSRDRDESGKFA